MRDQEQKGERRDFSSHVLDAAALLKSRGEVDSVLILAESIRLAESVFEKEPSYLGQAVWATRNPEVARWLTEKEASAVVLDSEYGGLEARQACSIIGAVVSGYLGVDEVVLLLAGDESAPSRLSRMRLLVPREDLAIVEVMARSQGLGKVDPKVLWSVVELAIQMGSVRHSQVSGTMITLGDADKILAISKRFLFEPFQFYPREQRNILDPRIRKTFEKYTRLDGAFVLSEEGVIEELVQTITAPVASDAVPPGLGSRHNAAGAISLYSTAFVVVVSQSAGNVTVFHGGAPVLSLKSR